MTVPRTILRFLLLLAALAFAGVAGAAWSGAGVGAGQDTVAKVGPAAAMSAVETAAAPKAPAFFRVVRPPGLALAGRVLGDGPPTRGLCPSCIRLADFPPLSPSLDSTRQRALARSLLAFAHDGVFARSGALSSFSTSLPPPLLA